MIAPELERAEIERAQRKPTESLNAYDCYLRGMAHVHSGARGRPPPRRSHYFIRRSTVTRISRRPTAWRHGAISGARSMAGWPILPRETAEGTRLARLADGELGADDAVALTRGGHALGQSDRRSRRRHRLARPRP